MTQSVKTDVLKELDQQILQLLNRRYAAAKKLLQEKDPSHSKLVSQEYATQLLKALTVQNPGPLPNDTLRAIFREIFSGVYALDKPVTVGFLGPETTFTHQAAMTKFGHGALYLPQQTIGDVFDVVERGQALYGVVPVENSTEGSVTHTLDMFTDSTLKISAEINMPIHHNLLSRCTNKNEIKVIYSHPQVFGQCRRWLHMNMPDVHLQEVTSTTEAAARCLREDNAGALAGSLAAERYKLLVLEENVEDYAGNLTRFLVLGSETPERTGDDKTSILFVVRDRVGALYDSLRPLSAHKVNLTFIESRPSRRKNWEYYFFVDFLGHITDSEIQQALEELAEHCQFVRILGSYPRAIV